jgi:hypothetical protein
MLLLTALQLLGPRDDLSKAAQRQVCFASRLPLSETLRRLIEYRSAYKQRFPLMAFDISLMGITESEDVDDITLEALNVDIVETLNMSTTLG